MFPYLAIVLLIGALLIFKFKSVYLKFILLVYWYPLLTMFLFCLEVPLGSSLDVVGRPAHEEYCDKAFIVALVGYFVFAFTIWSLRDKRFEFKRLRINETSRLILIFFLALISVIAYPKAFGIGDQRWDLIPGPWAVIAIAFNLILVLSFEKLKSISTLLQIFLLFITIKGGERASSLLFFVILFLMHKPLKANIIVENKFKLKTILFFSGLLLVSISAAAWRSGNSITFLYLLYNIVSVHTVKDVVHIYFSSFGYLNDFGLNFYPLLNEIGSILYLPIIGGTGNRFNFTEILRDYIPNYGGGLFYAEGVLIFGAFGPVIYAFLYGVVLRYLFVKSNLFVSIVFATLIVLQMRFQWYGVVYVYSPIVFSYILIRMLKFLSKDTKNNLTEDF
jgi:hypothetical protein